eukprot:scaffold287715_cov21-Tisochrysis_lutea.AAC.1
MPAMHKCLHWRYLSLQCILAFHWRCPPLVPCAGRGSFCPPLLPQGQCCGAQLRTDFMRKEENMLKKTIGFNWGPGAVSTSYWTGVRLCDMLKHVGAK